MRKTAVLLILTAVALLTATVCGVQRDKKRKTDVPEYVFTYAENQAGDYPTTQGAYKFAELVKEKTNGRIVIQISAEGALGDEKSVIEQMKFGGVAFARVSLSPLAEFAPKLNVLQMPYLYMGREHMWKVLDGPIGDEFLDSFEGSDLVALSWYDAGARSFYTTEKPIRKLEDMGGMNIRVQESELMEDVITALGANPVPLAYDKVYSALQTGSIQAAENNWASYESANHYEVAGYYTADEHSRVPELQLVSYTIWNKLTKEDQAVIRECAEESSRYERELWRDRERTSEEKVRAAGCEIVLLSTEEKAKFQKAVSPLYEKYCSEYMDMIDDIAAAGR